jgi:hypothetical protein
MPAIVERPKWPVKAPAASALVGSNLEMIAFACDHYVKRRHEEDNDKQAGDETADDHDCEGP